MPAPEPRPEPRNAPEVDPRELARYFGSTRRLASVLVGAESLGEDAAQDVILAALRRPPRVERGLGAWFVGAVRKRILHLRRSQTQRQLRQVAATVERSPQEPHEAVIRAETQARLVAAVHALPEPYRTPIILRYLEEHDTREVADELDRPLSTVQTQLQRGLGLLRERLAADDRRCEGDWREALAVLCVPHAGAIRARIEEQERLHRPSPKRWHSPGRLLVGAALVGALVIGVGVLRDEAHTPARASAELADGTRASAGTHDARSDSPATPGVRTALADAAPSSTAVEPLAGSPSQLHLRVRSASDQLPLQSAVAFVESVPAPGVTSAARAPDREAARAADAVGAIDLAVPSLPAWVRVEAPGCVDALLQVEGFGAPIDVELDTACELRVEAAEGVRLLVAKAWPAAVFPVATPPFDLELEAPDDARGARSATDARVARLASGRYVVSALVERAGRRLVDAALVDLAPDRPARWRALDARESGLRFGLAGAAHAGEPWSATILLGETGQVGSLAEDARGEPLVFESLPPGDHQLAIRAGGTEIVRRAIHVGPGPDMVDIALELPRASLTIEIEPLAAEEAGAMVFLTGPLDAPLPARRTHTAVGRQASFQALAPGRYEAWTRSPHGFGRRELVLRDGLQHVTLAHEQGANARFTYSGAPPIERHEVVLLAATGARLPVTFGVAAGAAYALGRGAIAGEQEPSDGSLTVALPAGEYELQVSVDGEFRAARHVRLEPGSSREFGPGDDPAAVALAFTRVGRPIAHQVIELAGHLAGASPLDAAPGPLWMYSAVTDGEGRVELPLAPARWTAMLAGGALVDFEVSATTRQLGLEFSAARVAPAQALRAARRE